MTTATFDLWQAYQASPVIWGAVQDTANLSFKFQGAPFVTKNEPAQRLQYSYDANGRLTAQSFVPSGTVVGFDYDLAGNRTFTRVTQGLGGL